MIQIKSPREIEIMARGGEILAATVRLLERSVHPGMSTMELDKIADDRRKLAHLQVKTIRLSRIEAKRVFVEPNAHLRVVRIEVAIHA